MERRDFLTRAAAGAASVAWLGRRIAGAEPAQVETAAEREKLLYTVCIYAGTGVKKPDYLATIDADPSSSTYGQVVHRLAMPNVGDELHHYSWSACGSCSNPAARHRYLVVPGFASSRVHIVDMSDPRQPRLHKVIEPEDVKRKTDLSAPHTVHCLPDGRVMISMLGDGAGNTPGGFLLLDADFNILGRWEKDAAAMKFNYDFWYQPRLNVMVSSEWSAPNTFRAGFKPDDVAAGKYGRHLHFWDWKERRILRSVDLGEQGLIPLEVRFHHKPDSPHGFVGAALSSTLWHWYQNDQGGWAVDKVAAMEPVPVKGWPFPVPGLITDLVLAMDDRWLYLSNWLHGDVRQYDVSDPAKPKLTAQVWLGGVIGKKPDVPGLTGGPQMLQLSRDGKRLYVTNSLYSSWDNQFYPDLGKKGSYLLQIDCDTAKGGMNANAKFLVDFGKEPQGPARAHEVRYPGGDCTSDIYV
jgi:selenium-binding protein 1